MITCLQQLVNLIILNYDRRPKTFGAFYESRYHCIGVIPTSFLFDIFSNKQYNVGRIYNKLS